MGSYVQLPCFHSYLSVQISLFGVDQFIRIFHVDSFKSPFQPGQKIEPAICASRLRSLKWGSIYSHPQEHKTGGTCLWVERIYWYCRSTVALDRVAWLIGKVPPQWPIYYTRVYCAPNSHFIKYLEKPSDAIIHFMLLAGPASKGFHIIFSWVLETCATIRKAKTNLCNSAVNLFVMLRIINYWEFKIVQRMAVINNLSHLWQVTECHSILRARWLH